MEQYFKNLYEALESGDPEVKTWFLVRHRYLPFIITGSYVIFSCYLGPAIMKNKKPFDLRIPMVIFNFTLVAVYVAAILTYFFNIRGVPFDSLCKRGAISNGTAEYIAARSVWVIYMLKYTELLDTVFFVLRKKQELISFLHVFHHTTVPLMGWTLFRTEINGFQSITAIINSFVHIIMYTYYGLAAMGPQVRQYLWWKKYLTQLQMVQFLLVVVLAFVVAPLFGCHMVVSTFVLNVIVPPVFLYLFYRYYTESFLQGKKPMNGVAKTEESANGRMIRETNGRLQACEKEE